MPRFGGQPVEESAAPQKKPRFGGVPVGDVPPSDPAQMAAWQAPPAGLKDDPDFDYREIGDTLTRFIGSMGRGFNQEIANVLGLPGDVTNRVLDLAGISSYKAHGSKELKTIMDDTASFRTTMPGDNKVAGEIGAMTPYVLGGAGAAIRSGANMMADAAPVLVPEGAGLARRAWEALRGGWREIAGSAARAPGAFTAAESASAVGAALGETGAEKMFPGSDAARITGNVLGGATGGAVPGMISGTGRAISSVFGESTYNRVADYFQKAAGDGLPKAREKLRDYPDEFNAGLTPAAIAGNTGLLRIERSLSRSRDDLGTQLRDRYDQTDAALQRAVENTEPGDATQQVVDEFFDGRLDTINKMVDDRISLAAKNADKALNEIPPAIRDQGTVSRIAREELDKAYDDAREVEQSHWSQIDKGYLISTDALKGRVREIRRQFDDAVEDPQNLPSDVIKAIDDLGDSEDLGRMLKLRSRITTDARNARAGDTPNRVKVKHLEELQESILTDIGATNKAREEVLRTGRQTATGPASIEARNRIHEVEHVRTALEYSRNLNDKFRRGPVGKLLGYEATGAGRTPDEITLDKIMQPGVKGVLQYKALVDAAGGTDGMRTMMESYLRNRYLSAVIKPGTNEVDMVAHRKFLANHGDIVKDFPKFATDIEDAGKRQAMLSAAQARGSWAKAKLERSRAQLWLNTDDVSTALAQVLNTPTTVYRGGQARAQKNQGAAAAALMRSADKDATGMATQGVRREFVQTILRKVRTNTNNPVTETGTMSPAALRKFLNQNQQAVGTILTPEQEQRFRRIVTEAEKSIRVQKVNMQGGSDTFENASAAAMILAKVLGARVGAKVGAGTTSLQSASMGARLAARFYEGISIDQANTLIEQAILDPKVMQDMLSRNVVGIRERERLNRLRSHIIAAGAGTVDFDDEAQ